METLRRAVSLGLMLLGSTPAWAGRGDVDPDYGDGGRVSSPSGVVLALPGDRLVIADAATDQGFRIRMVDATGHNVPEFGDGGVVQFDSLAAARAFVPEAAALAPNGDLIFTGGRLDTGARALLRLGNDGQPVLTFGDRGDGLVEPALTAARASAAAIDPDGKIVLAQGTWNPDESCESTARLQRLLSDGQPDAGYGGDGIAEIPELDICNGATVFRARPDGSTIVGDAHTIVAVDAAGKIDPTFGVDGRLAVSEFSLARSLPLTDGGLLIFGSGGESASSNETVFLKFDRHGQPDLDYGAGTGSVTVDLGAVLLGVPSSRESVNQLALDPDGEHIVAQLSVWHADGRLACGGIARLSIDGTPDAGFGRNGLTCLNINLNLIGVQNDGAPLFFGGYWSDSILRLLPDNSPSPGLLTVAPMSVQIDESGGTKSVAIERLAGRDGAVSINFDTVGRRAHIYCGYEDCYTDIATAGSDYTATSGRLDWASGDDTQRTITVSTIEDDSDENTETLGIEFAEPGGGVLLVAESPTIFIVDNDTAPPPPPSAPTSGGGSSGGGGAATWATMLALLTLLLLRRRQLQLRSWLLNGVDRIRVPVA